MEVVMVTFDNELHSSSEHHSSQWESRRKEHEDSVIVIKSHKKQTYKFSHFLLFLFCVFCFNLLQFFTVCSVDVCYILLFQLLVGWHEQIFVILCVCHPHIIQQVRLSVCQSISQCFCLPISRCSLLDSPLFSNQICAPYCRVLVVDRVVVCLLK